MIAAPLVSLFVAIRQHSENSNLAFDNRITEEVLSIQTAVYGGGRVADNAPADVESLSVSRREAQARAGDSGLCHGVILINAITADTNRSNQYSAATATSATKASGVNRLTACERDNAVMVPAGDIIAALKKSECRTIWIARAKTPQWRDAGIGTDSPGGGQSRPILARDQTDGLAVQGQVVATESDGGVSLRDRNLDAAAPRIGPGRSLRRSAGIGRIHRQQFAFAIDHRAPHLGGTGSKFGGLRFGGGGASRLD
jgi:hypothetical protein